MEPRGQNWNEQWPQYQRSDHRVREEQYRSHHAGKQSHYPTPDVRDSERQWYAPDPRYMYYMSGPPAPPPPPPPPPPEYSTAYSSQAYTPDRARSQSRQGYDYSPQSYWDYRNDYSYYDHGYYRGHYGYPAASGTSGWPVQGWRTEEHQEWSGAPYTPQHGYELRRDSGHYDGGVSVREIMDTRNEAGEVSDPGGLASSKTSGLSSSTYELSQYINGEEQSNAPPPPHSEAESKSVVPLKFCVPHVALSFGPAGQLVRVTPALPSHGEPAQVELHSLEVVLSDTREQNDMRSFPGPLAREDLHKVDVINFALQMADACLKDETTHKDSSASLLWHLLVLLCRQNGRFVGSDIAELLLRGRQSVGACEEDGEQSDVGSLIDLNETPKSETESFNTSDLLTGNPLSNEETSGQSIQNYTKLLLAGRKKEALDSAMRSGLWGHALFLASKMDSRAYNTVLSRFTGSLSPNDPLQTLFQFLSGRIPTVATSYSKEKWGDWKPHLAVMLSNETGDPAMHCKSIVNLGDTLASRGLLHAAHICYLTAHTSFSWYTNKAQQLVLLSSSHSASFADFSHNSAIRCTEVFEYCQKLGNPFFIIPSFLVYKFLYACRLLDCGLFSQAFHYCELIAKALLTIQEPHIILLQEVIKMVDRLKHSETQISETGADPDWLCLLRQRLQDLQMGNAGSNGLNLSAVEATAWAQEEKRECAGLGELSTSEMTHTSVTEDSHNGSENVHYNQLQSAAHPHSSYPAEEQFYSTYSPAEHAYTSYPSEEQSGVPETQTSAAEDRLPQIYAPVPIYSQQNLVSSELPPIHGAQDSVNVSDTLYHQTISGLDPRSHNNTDSEFSADKNMMGAPNNGTALGSADLSMMTPVETNTKETTSPKSEKETKSGWFSGWFKSKPKDSPKDQYEETKPALMESTPIPNIPAPPKVSSSMLPSQTQADGINPFSRRAGQKPGTAVGQGP